MILMRRLDPRWLILGSHVTLLMRWMSSYGLQRSWEQIILCYAVAGMMELGLSRTVRAPGRQTQDLGDRLLSAAVAASGLLLFIYSPYWWFHGLAAAVAIGSKFALRSGMGRHVFNPTNFAIMACLTVLPSHVMAVYPNEFTQTWSSAAHVVAFGGAAAVLSDRWRISLAYLATVLFVAVARAALFHGSVFYVLGPELGTLNLIFIWLMITDPRTTPSGHGPQWAMGCAIAAVELSLRWGEFSYEPFVATFIVSTLYGSRRLLAAALGPRLRTVERLGGEAVS